MDSKKNKASTSKPAAEWVELDKLKAWDRNPRKNDANVKRVAESIKRFGFAAPILARSEDCEIIAGHTRAQAAKLLGLPKVPVRFLDLDPADAHLLALADNKLNEFGEWDESKLAELLGELRLQGDDAAAVAGWSDADIDKFLHSVAPQGPGSNPNPADEWAGMPEFKQGPEVEPFRKITVSFDSQADVDEFQKLLGISVGDQSFAWFPPKRPEKLGDFEYVKD